SGRSSPIMVTNPQAKSLPVHGFRATLLAGLGDCIMKAIILVMLIVQVAAFVATATAVLTARSIAGRRPVWSTFTVALVVISGASRNIGTSHLGDQGADILIYGSPLLLGMGIMAALLLIRRRRGLDRLD